MTPAPNLPMIGMPPSALTAFHHALGTGRGAAEAAEMARRFGFAAGPAFHQAFQNTLDGDEAGPADELAPGEFWTRLSDFFSGSGWGQLQFSSTHPGVAMLRAERWAESEGRTSRHPACHITTGLLAALVTRIAGVELAVLEVECRSAGAERCSFLIGGQPALQAVYARLRQGEPFDDAIAALG